MIRREGGPGVRRKKWVIERLCTSPPESSVVVCIDEMVPVSVRPYQGREPIYTLEEGRAGRSKQEREHGRDRNRGGCVFGAFESATGEALEVTPTSRSSVTFVDFLEKVGAWVPESVEKADVILDNPRAHKAYGVPLFSLAHPGWEFAFQPEYAAWLDLIEPRWKTLRSLALAGRRFELWEEVETATKRAVEYWNAHRHPYPWGRRRRRRTARKPGVGAMPTIPAVNG